MSAHPETVGTLHAAAEPVKQALALRNQFRRFPCRKQAILALPMDEQQPTEIVEFRVSRRYITAQPWVVQAIGGFLSAYFMEQPEFRVQRQKEEPESGAHLWICEVPATMKVQRLLKRLQEDIPPFQAQQIATDLPTAPSYLLDSPE